MSTTKRYYKATIGECVYFRATTRTYASASVGRYGLGFSSNPPAAGASPAIEIDKVEFNRLVALKRERVVAAGRNPAWHDTSPQDSWVAVEVAYEVVS